MPERQIRVGLIGAGGNTKAFHIPGLAKQDGVQILAVVNRTRESSQRVADEFGIPKVHDHWQALLGDSSIDAVCIGTWPYMHAPITIAALDAGKHVLCEARMAMDHSQARTMLEASLRHPALTAQIVPAPQHAGVRPHDRRYDRGWLYWRVDLNRCADRCCSELSGWLRRAALATEPSIFRRQHHEHGDLV